MLTMGINTKKFVKKNYLKLKLRVNRVKKEEPISHFCSNIG